MSRTVLIEDEFGEVYTYLEPKFNLKFPMKKIGIPADSTIVFSNTKIGEPGLTDQIVNNESEILSLTLEEILDRIRLSSIESIEVKYYDVPHRWVRPHVIPDIKNNTYIDYLVIFGIVIILLSIFVISLL